MGKPAIDIFAEQAEWMKDRIVYGTTAYIAENFDSCPLPGLGVSFVRRSAESVLTERVEERLVPRLDDHLETQIAFTRELAGADDRDAVADRFRDRLLASDPLWDLLDGSDAVREEARADIVAANVAACGTAADWMEAVGGAEFDHYAALAHELNLSPDEAAQELDDLLYYVELVEAYRDHVDASDYSSVLDSDRVHDWFVDRFVEGLKLSEAEILDEVRADIRDHVDG